MRPLSGVRVIDFTRVVSGPYATLILTDLGAEVIKVERPGTGDDARTFGPPFVADQSTYFAGLNRGKKSITLDLASAGGQDAAFEICRQCDVLVENFRPGFMERVGLGFDRIAESNPRLIYCSISGYGSRGPKRDWAAYDVTVSALSGMMSITGDPDGPPVKTGVASLDVATGIYAFGGIVTALYERERTGTGRRIDVSMLDVQMSTLINAASAYLLAGEVMTRNGTAHPSIVPYQAFRASDEWLIIGALNDRMFQRLCRVLGHPEWAVDTRFRTNTSRVANRVELVSLIGERVSNRTRAWWEGRLARAGVAVAPINTIADAFRDPQVIQSGIVQSVQDPRLGLIRVVGTPLRFDGRLPVPCGVVPRLGQYNDLMSAFSHGRRGRHKHGG